jgi:hypothetical protein
VGVKAPARTAFVLFQRTSKGRRKTRAQNFKTGFINWRVWELSLIKVIRMMWKIKCLIKI